MMIVSPSKVKSCICVAVATTELTQLYPNDIELVASATTLWNTICEANLLARAVWAIRGKRALQVI